jgi:hypothetical protein
MKAQAGKKLGVTIDRALLSDVDAYLRDHPGRDLDTVVDEALRIWLDVARAQDQAMDEQYAAPDDRPEHEVAAWNAIRDASARMLLGRDRE